MPVDYYIGKSFEELTAILQQVQERQAKGGLRDVTIAGVRTRREFDKEQNSVQEIERLRWSIWLRINAMPDAAPNKAILLQQWPNPYLEKVRRTSTRYLFS